MIVCSAVTDGVTVVVAVVVGGLVLELVCCAVVDVLGVTRGDAV